jgi:hypothetical protein
LFDYHQGCYLLYPLLKQVPIALAINIKHILNIQDIFKALKGQKSLQGNFESNFYAATERLVEH